MADSRRYSDYGARQNREQPPERSRAQAQRSASSTHSSYEEAIRRSNERLGNVQRRARRMEDAQRDTYADANASYAPRRQQTTPSSQRTRQGGRRTVRLDGYEEQTGQPDSYTQRYQQAWPARQQQQNPPAAQQQRGTGLPIGLPSNLPNPFSRQHQGSNLREQQLQGRSRNSGAYQSRRPAFPAMSMPMQGSGTGFNGVVIRAAICVVLFIVIVFSIMRVGPAAAGLSEAQSNLATHQETLDTQNSANETLQGQLEQMQQTIEKYNDLKASQS